MCLLKYLMAFGQTSSKMIKARSAPKGQTSTSASSDSGSSSGDSTCSPASCFALRVFSAALAFTDSSAVTYLRSETKAKSVKNPAAVGSCLSSFFAKSVCSLKGFAALLPLVGADVFACHSLRAASVSPFVRSFLSFFQLTLTGSETCPVQLSFARL